MRMRDDPISRHGREMSERVRVVSLKALGHDPFTGLAGEGRCLPRAEVLSLARQTL